MVSVSSQSTPLLLSFFRLRVYQLLLRISRIGRLAFYLVAPNTRPDFYQLTDFLPSAFRQLCRGY